MESKRASLTVTQVTAEGNAAKVEWDLTEGEGRYLARIPFEASFHWRDETPLDFGDDGSDVLRRTMTFAFLAIAIPTLCYENDEVLVTLPFRVTAADRCHWQATLRFLNLNRSKLAIEGDGPVLQLKYLRPPANPNRPGLFYGGGLESNAALASLLDRLPLLFVTDGPGWMNNQTDANIGVKYQLENHLCDRFGLELLRARSNARQVSYLPEPTLHYYCSGGIFHWMAAAAGLRLGMVQFFISQELEGTLIREHGDLSLKPDSVFGSGHPECPMVVPIFGWAAKAELFDRLKDTDLFEYVYSCSHNGERRWCGKCGKCWRMAEYCDMFGIPIERLGMDERPRGSLGRSRRHRVWQLMADHLYPQPGGRTVDPWPLPIMEQVLADLAEQHRCEVEGGRFQPREDQIVITPEAGGEASLRFPRVVMKGFDRFTSGIDVPGDAAWRVGVSISDEKGDVVAELSQLFTAGASSTIEHVFPELFGEHSVVLSVHRDSGDSIEPPTWDVPRLARGPE
jgi:hypothetical protein